jgi:hypothetical protein
MRFAIRTFVAVVFVWCATAAGQDKTPPDKLVFQKPVTTVFPHAAHIERANGDCTTCHDKFWPKLKEESVKSAGCKTCHKAGGVAFESKGNCARCHPEGTAKKTVAAVQRD